MQHYATLFDAFHRGERERLLMTELTTSNRCAATKANGEPCGAYATQGSRFCFWHDPEREDERRDAQSNGGQARHGRNITRPDGEPPQGAAPDDLIDEAVRVVWGLEDSVAKARALGYLAKIRLNVQHEDEVIEALARLRRELDDYEQSRS